MEFLNILREIFQSDTGSFGFVVVFVGAIFYAIVKITGAVTKINMKTEGLDHFERKVYEKFDRIETKFDRIETKFETKFSAIKDELSSIKAFFEVIKDKYNPLAQKHSPLSLTSKGKEYYDALHIDQLVTRHYEIIKMALQQKLPVRDNPYDIQVASFSVGDSFTGWLDKTELNTIKLHAFNSGYDLDIYGMLFGIEIRDRVLEAEGFSLKPGA